MQSIRKIHTGFCCYKRILLVYRNLKNKLNNGSGQYIDEFIPTVQCFKYLEIFIEYNVKFKQHIESNENKLIL